MRRSSRLRRPRFRLLRHASDGDARYGDARYGDARYGDDVSAAVPDRDARPAAGVIHGDVTAADHVGAAPLPDGVQLQGQSRGVGPATVLRVDGCDGGCAKRHSFNRSDVARLSHCFMQECTRE